MTSEHAATRSCQSSDRRLITYHVQGRGPALLLLHGGFVHDRDMWRQAGYVESLASQYRLIIPDLRGHGASARPTRSIDYSIERFTADALAVLNAEDIRKAAVWGYSLGACVALRFAAAQPGRTLALVLLGGAFGPALPEQMRIAMLERLDQIEMARRQGKKMELSEEEQAFVSRADLGVVRAIYQSFTDWSCIEPRDISCPFMFVAGTGNPWSMENLQTYAAPIQEHGGVLTLLRGLSHQQELTAREDVLASVLPFLQQVVTMSR